MLGCAVCCCYPLLLKMVELLVAAGAAVDVTPGPTSNRTPLVEAAVKGNVAMMDILLGE